VIHHVFATKSNIGDWLSAKGIQHLLRPFEVRESFCDTPFVAETLERLSALQPMDTVVIGGGGLFMDYFTPFWEGFAALADRVPFCIWGVGYCDVKNAESRADVELLRTMMRKSRLCVVRDELTRNYLGDSSPPVACPSMTVVGPPATPGFGVLHADHYDVVGNDVYEIVNEAARSFAERTRRPFAGTDNQIEDGDEGALSEILKRYEKADIVVSSRLHGCIIGVAMGRRVIAVAGDRKVDSFMDAAGLADWVCQPDDLGNFRRRLDQIETQEPPRAFVERTRQGNLGVADRIKEMLGSESS
jgi:polysaccharide pyruvyl transferase WcaK-like protein